MAPTLNKTVAVKGAVDGAFLALGKWKTSPEGVSKRGKACSVVDLHFEDAAISGREGVQDGRKLNRQRFGFEKTDRGIEKLFTTPPGAFQLGL